MSPLNVQMQPFDVVYAQGSISSDAVEYSGVYEHVARWLVQTIPDKIMHPDLAENLKTVWRSFGYELLALSAIFRTNQAMARYGKLQANAYLRQ